jgi:glycosyltransferase involved in cell wall biosynthesis
MAARWRRILRRERIEAALISYANWHRLALVAREEGVWTALEMHEYLTQQFAVRERLAGRPEPAQIVLDNFRSEEMRCLSSADCVVAINEVEGDMVRKAIDKPVVYLPMCLKERRVAPEAVHPSDILVVGSFIDHNRRGLKQFLDGPWKTLLQKRPQTRLTICGRVAAVAEAGPNVECHPDVPDLTPFYQGARVVLLVTVAGAGIKIKTIEALAHGCCIVAHKHSVEGVPFIHQQDGVALDTLDAAAEPILQLLENPVQRDRYASNALKLFRKHFGFERSQQVFRELFQPAFKAPEL